MSVPAGLELLATLRDALQTPEGRRLFEQIRALAVVDSQDDGEAGYAARIVARTAARADGRQRRQRGRRR
jgi:hypothetical protein